MSDGKPDSKNKSFKTINKLKGVRDKIHDKNEKNKIESAKAQVSVMTYRWQRVKTSVKHF